MRHKLVRAVRLMAFVTTVMEERSDFVWLKARATGMTVEIREAKRTCETRRVRFR